jgi:hypothetical protein
MEFEIGDVLESKTEPGVMKTLQRIDLARGRYWVTSEGSTRETFFTLNCAHLYTLVSRPEVEPQEPEWVVRERLRLPKGWTLTATGRPLLGSTEPLYTLRAPCGRAPDMGAHLASADMGHDGVVRWVKQAADDLGLPDPYAQEPRPFVVGDRVRLGVCRESLGHEDIQGVIVKKRGVGLPFDVRWDNGANGDGRYWYAAAELTLATPAPPITLEGDAAVLPVPETEPPLFPREYLGCMDCGCARESGCVLCTDCCTCSGVADNERCPTCGFGPLPALPRPYDEGGTNPAGFPTMPEAPGMSDAMAFVAEPENQSALTMSSSPVGGALVQEQLRRTVPLDCYLRDREAVRVWGEKLDAKHEAAEAGPRLGDLVTAWYQEEGKEPARLTGVLVEMEDRFITLRRSGRCNVCIRAGANVVTRKESM